MKVFKGIDRFPIVVLFFLFLSFQTQSQNFANNWAFADYEVNFNGFSAQVTRTYASRLNRGMGVMSDANGALLFYTDGYTAWNKNHQTMPNGNILIPSTASVSREQSMVIPKPGSSTVFYIFSQIPYSPVATSGLFYSEVDIQQDGGLGDVVVKGVQLLDKPRTNFTATLHANQKDVWVLTQEENTNKYLVLLITDQGISNQILTFNLGAAINSSNGQLKFSPDGKHVGLSHDRGVVLFDFDAATGTLSNDMAFSFYDLDNSPIVEGLEFSSDGTKIYVTELHKASVYQFDLSEYSFEKIRDSRTPLPKKVINNHLRQFQLGPDGKIYVTKGGGGGGTGHLGVIDNANARAKDVVLTENGLYLLGGNSFVNYTPSFIQNYFFKTSFRYDNSCEDETTRFTITNEHLLDSVKWSFGEGSTTEIRNPEFVFVNPGEYTITLVAYYPEKTDTVKQTLKINPKTVFELGADVSLCSGLKIGVDSRFNVYAWSTGDTTSHIRILESGLYFLTNTNEFNCSYKDSVFVTVNPLPVIDLPDTVLLNETEATTLNAGAFHSYQWNTGATTSSLAVDEAGWYSVMITDEVGCKQAKSVYVSDGNATADVNTPDWVWLNPRPTGKHALDVHFIDDLTGFVVNGQEILRTTDGGGTWDVQMKMPLGSEIAFSGTIGYVIGNYGMIYKSTHRGGGWNKLPFKSTDNLNSITVIGDTLLVTSSDNLFVSKNGGASWVRFPIDIFRINDAFFTSSKIGHAATHAGMIRTKDGGLTWQVTSGNNTSNFFNTVFFVNKTIGYASKGFGEIYKTINGGSTWSLVGEVGTANSIFFLNQNTGFVIGSDGAIYKTTNGGVTWVWVGFNGRYYQNDLHGIHFIDENVGFAAGLRGRIIKTTNGGLTWKEYGATYTMITQLDVSEETDYALAGNELFKTTAGGNWISVGTPVKGIKCGGIDFINNDVGFALVGGTVNTSGTIGMVYKTVNGGASWEKAHSNYEIAGEDLTFIIFLDENVGFVSGGYNGRATRKTTDGGKTWTVVSLFHAREIQFINPELGFACADPFTAGGKIYKTTDSGNTWQLIFQDESAIRSIHFVNDQVGYAVGEGSSSFKTINGGKNWEPIETPYGWLVGVKFYTEMYGFIVDDDGSVWKTYDGGLSWISDYSYYGLTSIEMSDSSVFVAGDFGAILKKDLTLDQLIYFDSLSLHSITQVSAIASVFVKSGWSLENAILSFEVGEKSGVYDQSHALDTLNGYATTSNVFEFIDLQPGTNYFCRYVIKQGDMIAASDELSFTTYVISDVPSEAESKDKFHLYPNPTDRFMKVRVGDLVTSYTYEIKDVMGKVITANVSSAEGVIDLSGIQSGMYMLAVNHGGSLYVRRIIVR